MRSHTSCPICGKPIAPDALQGLCPTCLLQAGVPTENSGPASPRRSFVPPTPAELAPHFPQLEILALIGQGGMGAVYRARQPALDRLVALKLLSPATSRDPAFAERFVREARALAKLSHPHIVAVHDHGQAGGFHYLVMEFVDGLNLRQLLDSARMTPSEALAIVPPICEALQFAHDRGVVHRDIKPENILVGKNGVVKIADFGLAKGVGAGAAEFSITGAGDVMGTPHYMAPEQVEHPLEVDHRADIYSVGVVFYQMLTGELPLGRFAPPSRKVRIDVRLDEVVLRALEKEPALRYQQASGLKTAVETIAATGASQPAGATVRPVDTGLDYRSKATWWGLPLVHVATGTDPITGKRRVAKGIVAIGTTAVGVVALGGLACGGITFGGLSVGVLAFGGSAVGVVALGGLAIAALFAAGGLTVGTVAVGGTAIGYLVFGEAAIGVHGVGRNVADPVAREFFTQWATPLLRAATDASLVVGTLVLLATVWAAWRAHAGLRGSGASLRQRWLAPARWLGLAGLMLVVVGLLLSFRPYWRFYARNNIGLVSQLSPLAVTQDDSRGMVVVEGWLVEGAPTMNLAGERFDPRRPDIRTDLVVLPIIAPLSSPAGGRIAATVVVPTGRRRVRFQVTPTQKHDGYRYTVVATLDSGARVTADDGRAKVQPDEKVEITASADTAADRPVYFELGSIAPARKHTAVFVFRPLTGSQSIQSAPPDADRATVSATKEAPPPRNLPASSILSVRPSPVAPPNSAPTEFDATEGDPEVLAVLLQQARAELDLVESRHAAGLVAVEEIEAARLKPRLLEARLSGDRVAFAVAALTAAIRRLELVSAQRQAGLATDAAVASAQAEQRVAEIRLRRAEAAQAVAPSGSSAPNPTGK